MSCSARIMPNVDDSFGQKIPSIVNDSSGPENRVSRFSLSVCADSVVTPP